MAELSYELEKALERIAKLEKQNAALAALLLKSIDDDRNDLKEEVELLQMAMSEDLPERYRT